MFDVLDSQHVGFFLPELHTFGIGMPECSKRKRKGDLSFAYKHKKKEMKK